MRVFLFVLFLIVGFCWWHGAAVVGNWIGEHVQSFAHGAWDFLRAFGEGAS